MAREKKDSVALNINLATNINEKLIKYCEISGLTKTKAVEKAIEYYCNEQLSLNKNSKKFND